MYRAIIVEDETDIRRGLRDCVDWESYGIEIVYDAVNGRDALQYVQEHPTDIIISDVVMPIMDGIELVTRVQTFRPQTRALFISGYQDVEYIKGAFKVSAIDYIFKPVDMAELDTVLTRVVAQCDAGAARTAAREATATLKQEECLTNILEGNSEGLRALRELSLTWVNEQVHVAIAVSIRSAGAPIGSGHIRLQQRGVLHDALSSLSASTRAPDGGRAAGEVPRIAVVTGVVPAAVLLSAARAPEEAIVHQITGAILAAFAGKSTVSIGIGSSCRGQDGIRRSYRGAVGASGLAFFSGYNHVYRVPDLERGLDDDPVPIDYATREVVDAVLTGRRSAVRPALKHFVHAVVDHSPRDPAIARALVIDLLFRTGSGLRSAGVRDAASMVAELEADGLGASRTIDEVYTTIASPLEEAAVAVADLDRQRSGFLGERMKAYLRSRLSENVTIADLAAELLMTPNYVSSLFKKETGQTVREYLTSLRIARAKELLSDPRLKLYEVADSVGYKDRDYFTKTFKRYSGMTPKQYRDQELA